MFEDKSKIVFFSDMDGTLLNHDKTVSQRNLDAIARLRRAGGMFVVATGRIIQATRHYFEPIKLDCPCILCNGGMIYDCGTDSTAWSRSLDRSMAGKVTEELLERFPGACAEICMPHGIYDININDTERMHWKKAGFTGTPVDSFDSLPEGDISKILYAMPEELIDSFIGYCSGISGVDADFVVSAPTFAEMLPKDCSKGTAMKKLLSIYGLENAETVAMGDYDNDLTMLQYADFAASPSNARDCVKEICNVVTPSDCEGGSVADIIDLVLG